MQMEVVGDACPGHLAQIHADVESIGTEGRFQNLNRLSQIFKNIRHLFPGELIDIVNVPYGSNH